MQDQMAAYFSPGLRRLMQNQDQSMLEPAMVDCTVMFADRRGHSRMLELAKSDDEILDRLDENQRVVGLITEEIFRSSGVVTDFAGDGALGLWGWPNIGVADHNHALEAVEAAEAILHRLADRVVYEDEVGTPHVSGANWNQHWSELRSDEPGLPSSGTSAFLAASRIWEQGWSESRKSSAFPC